MSPLLSSGSGSACRSHSQTDGCGRGRFDIPASLSSAPFKMLQDERPSQREGQPAVHPPSPGSRSCCTMHGEGHWNPTAQEGLCCLTPPLLAWTHQLPEALLITRRERWGEVMQGPLHWPECHGSWANNRWPQANP